MYMCIYMYIHAYIIYCLYNYIILMSIRVDLAASKMKALKCKTLGASVMYVETLYIVYTYIDGKRGQMRVCMGTYTYM